jgi:hypothetical protein
MNTPIWQNRLYSRILRESQQDAVRRQFAYLAAGWLSFFGIRPRLAGQAAPSFTAIAGGGVLLVLGLVLAGPVLNLMRPVFRAAGAAPAMTWPVAAIAGLFGWRYAAGRKLLRAFAAANGST